LLDFVRLTVLSLALAGKSADSLLLIRAFVVYIAEC